MEPPPISSDPFRSGQLTSVPIFNSEASNKWKSERLLGDTLWASRTSSRDPPNALGPKKRTRAHAHTQTCLLT